ncbi:unnamed protein product, partial [Adineta ricciae]
MTSDTEDILVYALDVPADIPNNDVGQMLQNRIERIGRMKIKNVKYYSKLCIAVIQMMNEDDKIHLISNMQSAILDSQRGTSIFFTDQLELDAFIVLDRNASKFPSSEQVTFRLKGIFKITNEIVCELISDQFPNVFHITLNSLDDLVKVANIREIQIDNIVVTIYPRAECTFLEDLPPYITDAKLLSAISSESGGKELSTTSLYVQYNNDTGNAIVLTAKFIKTWSIENVVTIDGRK